MIRGVETRPELNAQLKELSVQPSHIVTLPCGKTFDLTNPYTTPFGAFDDVYGSGATNAMKVYGGPWEQWVGRDEWKNCNRPLWRNDSIYRVKLVPVVETITHTMWRCDEGNLWNYAPERSIPVTVTHARTNGVIDNDSYRVVAK